MVDLTGATRVRNEIVDIGAYGCQSRLRPLTAPEHLVVQGNSGDDAILTWNEVPEAVRYQIAYSVDDVLGSLRPLKKREWLFRACRLE